jgi:hypothetical protein
MQMLTLECDCSQISLSEWESLMENAVDADGEALRKKIKEDIPELYEALALDFYNPYEQQSQETETHYIYVHSAIEFFLRKN